MRDNDANHDLIYTFEMQGNESDLHLLKHGIEYMQNALYVSAAEELEKEKEK
jgi:hypothetical protein